jgi:hypothetical protein
VRALAIVDGEHYAPVVRDALAELPYEFVAAVLVGGREKLRGEEDYGVPLAADVESGIADHRPDVVVDVLSVGIEYDECSVALPTNEVLELCHFASRMSTCDTGRAPPRRLRRMLLLSDSFRSSNRPLSASLLRARLVDRERPSWSIRGRRSTGSRDSTSERARPPSRTGRCSARNERSCSIVSSSPPLS